MEDRTSPRPAFRLATVVRWALPAVGCVALAFGGLWAVDVSQRGAVQEAFNPVSAMLYAAMVGLYGLAAWVLRRWRRPGEDGADRAGFAALEAAVVGLLAAPVAFAALTVLLCYVGEACT